MIGLLLAPLLFFQAPPPFTIGGTVVHSVTGAPLKKARVFLISSTRPGEVSNVVTGENGRFRFERLKQGKYSLWVERLGFVRQGYKARYLYQQYTTAVVVGENESTENLVFRMIPGGVISGHTTDSRGEAVQGLLVRAYRIVGTGSQKRAQASLTASTDDRGYYRIYALAAGTYVLALSGRSWRYESARDTVKSAYPVTFYPGTTNAEQAGMIRVEPGKEAQGDVVVNPVPAWRLQGTVAKSEHAGRLTVNLRALGPYGSIFYVADGVGVGGDRFTIEDVPVGQYVLMLWEDTTHIRAVRTLDVTNSDLEITVGDIPLPEVSVKVEMRGTPRNPTSPVLVGIRPLEGDLFYTRPVPAGTTVLFPPIPPGRYQIIVSQGRQLAVLSLTARGAVQKMGLLDVPESGAVEVSVVADATAAEVNGRVFRGEVTEAGVLVVLVPRTGWENVSTYRYDQSDSDGTFVWHGVGEGEYVMFAFEDGEPADYADPEVIRALLSKGRAVTVSGAADQNVRLELPAKIN
jgi:hypothetical protein